MSDIVRRFFHLPIDRAATMFKTKDDISGRAVATTPPALVHRFHVDVKDLSIVNCVLDLEAASGRRGRNLGRVGEVTRPIGPEPQARYPVGMVEESWRTPTSAKRALVERWVDEWNGRMGDHAIVGDGLVVRASCSCGKCPSFSAKPLVIDPARARERPLAVEGSALRENGTAAAGLIIWGLDDSELDFEVYSLDAHPITLEELTFTFSGDAK